MDLWIRSQKKDKLFKINGVDITKMNDNSYEVTGYTSYDIYLGTYKTKERAIKVLDEIQDLLQNAYAGNGNRIVYQMPEN